MITRFGHGDDMTTAHDNFHLSFYLNQLLAVPRRVEEPWTTLVALQKLDLCQARGTMSLLNTAASLAVITIACTCISTASASSVLGFAATGGPSHHMNVFRVGQVRLLPRFAALARELQTP